MKNTKSRFILAAAILTNLSCGADTPGLFFKKRHKPRWAKDWVQVKPL